MSKASKKHLISAAIVLLLARCFQSMAFAEPSPAAFAILDGDRVDVSYHFTEESVPLRLYGVDAPEQGQPYWQEAKDFSAGC